MIDHRIETDVPSRRQAGQRIAHRQHGAHALIGARQSIGDSAVGGDVGAPPVDMEQSTLDIAAGAHAQVAAALDHLGIGIHRLAEGGRLARVGDRGRQQVGHSATRLDLHIAAAQRGNAVTELGDLRPPARCAEQHGAGYRDVALAVQPIGQHARRTVLGDHIPRDPHVNIAAAGGESGAAQTGHREAGDSRRRMAGGVERRAGAEHEVARRRHLDAAAAGAHQLAGHQIHAAARRALSNRQRTGRAGIGTGHQAIGPGDRAGLQQARRRGRAEAIAEVGREL